MEPLRFDSMEFRFACLIWERAPISSGDLVPLCGEVFGWKKSTTYTMLKRLQEKGYVKNVDAMVTSLIERSEVLSNESEAFVSETFSGSLPGFLTAFFGGRKITEEEAKELKDLIDYESKSKQIDVRIDEIDGFFKVICTLKDDYSVELYSVSLTVPDRKTAISIRRNFISQSEELYRITTEILTGETL